MFKIVNFFSVNVSSYSPNSSTSTTRWSRLQEKEQLCNLNDRLATYIEVIFTFGLI